MLPGEILNFSYAYIIAKYQMRMHINKEKHFFQNKQLMCYLYFIISALITSIRQIAACISFLEMLEYCLTLDGLNSKNTLSPASGNRSVAGLAPSEDTGKEVTQACLLTSGGSTASGSSISLSEVFSLCMWLVQRTVGKGSTYSCALTISNSNCKDPVLICFLLL